MARRRGMGEVYRARDPRLPREVAINLLRSTVWRTWVVADSSSERRKPPSHSNHPHIITIHEIESVGDHDFIVMECGPGLDALIPQQRMRLSEALRKLQVR